MEEQFVEYEHDGAVFEAYVAFDATTSTPQPAVLVSHAWRGRSELENEKARALAKLGYVGFALDMYGKGVVGANPNESGRLMQPFLDNRALLLDRQRAALSALRNHPHVDASRIAAIGFCFGGLCVLDLARSGADVRGVASFHGLLGAPNNADSRSITAKVLVLHGHDDPMAPLEQVVALEQELDAAKADWQIHVYGGTMHSFTNPEADNAAMGTVYNPLADQRSWATLQNFLAEVLA